VISNTLTRSGEAEFQDSATLIDVLLAEQRSLTAVEQFSRAHDGREFSARVNHYRRLLPTTLPNLGQQYAFEVDLDKCSGCKACVTACHSLNGLEETETWRSVGLLVSPPVPNGVVYQPPSQQHVTTACHHCADPGCANGCPVLAYDKDPVTGIVRHLDDQCMGCSYCIMKCPYEVPKFSKRLGVVRKCDMCSQRLAVGEAPACVQACPNEAIKITLVEVEDIQARYAKPQQNDFLPDSPHPGITKPTTQFRSAKLPAHLVAADHMALRLDHAHWPLVIMLVLTQIAAGLSVMAAVSYLTGEQSRALPVAAFAILNVGLVASVLHLGRPLKAWRAFLGWRKSWLSREIVAFNAFAGAALLGVICPAASVIAAVAGIGAVAASVMVYVDTKRPFWSGPFVTGNFFGTALSCGAGVAAGISAATANPTAARSFAILTLCTALVLTAWRLSEVRKPKFDSTAATHLNSRLIFESLGHAAKSHVVAVGAASICFALAWIARGGPISVWTAVGAGLLIAGEIVARYLFFTAGTCRRMPGGLIS